MKEKEKITILEASSPFNADLFDILTPISGLAVFIFSLPNGLQGGTV